MFLAGKTALVTGGGRGIGRAVAALLAERGARVVVAGRTLAELEETAHAVGGLALRMDAADRASVQAALIDLGARAGRIDILVNNAGVAESAPFDRTTDAMWDWMMAVK